ncbi:hypothetical protein JST97_27260 [bacterium]|nr:hypothetical protein [bacterium]
MNYVLPLQKTREVKSLVLRRGRRVADEVLQQVRRCSRQSLEQSGFLSWTSTEGKTWGVFQNGRCHWLLHVDSEQERVCYYRLRGDLEVMELHEPGHAGTQVCEKVEQIGTLVHSYECLTDAQIHQIERKVRWWQLQRWLNEARTTWQRLLGRKKAA